MRRNSRKTCKLPEIPPVASDGRCPGIPSLVQEADPGATAMKILSGGSIDVVITDLRLPELDLGSPAATRTGLSIEVTVLPESPAHDGKSARALRLGAHHYLTRPSPGGDEVILTVDRAVETKRRLSH